MHGGMSPGASKKNALKHGRYTAEAIARRQTTFRYPLTIRCQFDILQSAAGW
jgi:hypothetical protein